VGRRSREQGPPSRFRASLAENLDQRRHSISMRASRLPLWS
jgi:hypothetical protein